MRIEKFHDLPGRIHNAKLSAMVYKVNKGLVNLLYPRTVRCAYGVDEKSNVVISLTSFPGRIQTVWITVATLLNQTVKPRAVILWLAEDQFPNGEAGLPEKLLQVKEKGLTIRFCDNLYPHKKYYYTMLENPDAFVITADDDVFYPEYLVDELVRTAQKNPGAVCCTWAHEISLDDDGCVKPYNEWRQCIMDGTTPSVRIMPVGCGGVLYPPHCLDEAVFDKTAIQRLCLRTDDLWLKCMAVLKGTPAVQTERKGKIFFTIVETQASGLHHENVGEDRNNEAMGKILAAYPEVRKILSGNNNDILI